MIPSLTSHSSHHSTIEPINYHRIPMFGPLGIENHKQFVKEAKAFFHARSSTPFPYQLSLSNFELLYDLGEGAFGRVILVRYKNFDKPYYAMKIIDKKSVIEKNIIESTLREKQILQGLNNPFCIRLEYFTSDKSNLYYILPYIAGGDLFNLLENQGQLNENLAKFYTAQVVLALEFMHSCGIVHRDLKLENMIIDHLGYLKIADFGLAKELKEKGRAYTFCGTPDYIAPEVILGNAYSFAVDWWAMGVMTFEMVYGKSPFYDNDHLKTYKKIVDSEYSMPSEFSLDLRDIVTRLLQVDVTRRLGNLRLGVDEVKQHRWFKEIHWLNLLNRRIVPPYVPPSRGDFVTGNFPHLKKIRPSFSITSNTMDSNIDESFKEF